MDIKLDPVFLSTVIRFCLFVFLPAFLGSYGSDYFRTFTGKNYKVRLSRVFFGATTSCIINAALFYDYFIGKGQLNYLAGLSFLFGCVGFEIMGHLATLEGWLSLVTLFRKIADPVLKFLVEFQAFRKQRRDDDEV